MVILFYAKYLPTFPRNHSLGGFPLPTFIYDNGDKISTLKIARRNNEVVLCLVQIDIHTYISAIYVIYILFICLRLYFRRFDPHHQYFCLSGKLSKRILPGGYSIPEIRFLLLFNRF